MMKTLINAAVAATVATGLFASPAFAAPQPSAVSKFSATARIVTPLVLTNDADLNFGTITKLASLTSGDVTVGRAGGSSDACDSGLSCTTPSPAKFTVTGSINQPLTLTVTSPSTLVSTTNTADTVAFSVDAPVPDEVTLDDKGTASFEIGGTITVLAATADGTYTENVDITVEYS